MKKTLNVKNIIIATLLLVVVLLSMTVVTTNAEEQSEADKIMALEKMWSDKFAEKDVAWMVNLHDENAVQLPPGAPMIQGKEALKAAWEGMVNTEGLALSWGSSAAFVSEGGDMAYDYGTGVLINPDGSKVDAKYLVVWKKVNGEWKVVADAFNFSGVPTKLEE